MITNIQIISLYITCIDAFFIYMHSVLSSFLQPHGLQPTRLLCPWDFSGKNTGVGCNALLQGIYLAQVWNPHLLHSISYIALPSDPPGKKRVCVCVCVCVL